MTALLISSGASAQVVRVAVAANLQPVIKVLQQDFKKRTGITIEPVSAASGTLATQIRNGAPFDIFMSADTELPKALFKDGFAANAPVVYAQGILILCSRHKVSLKKWWEILLSDKVTRFAIANPAVAPYGKAAEAALKRQGVYDKLKSKMVVGESIGQVNTYISTDAVNAGFTTLAFFRENSSKIPLVGWTIPDNTYPPIEQGMILLKRAEDNAAAIKFYKYIFTAEAKKLIVKYGYHVL
ncbi:molybdate ABC transporter substrate-binding protein [Mucilaginibacter terrenus]|uniref:Molybdate ABC transporter substrate-binding protein n=2 Tax=Mucilaginibacter terrenus TaxID=2482727 RepID=A0A3E2NRA1_9SPHI|nr:molybdate ABC transporter substrate-binding protein [Mucilaginibacter terrenus]